MKRAAGLLLLLLLPARAHAQLETPPRTSDDGAPTPNQDDDLTAALGGTSDLVGPKLDVYGFADTLFWLPIMGRDNPWRRLFKSESSFIVGNLNLYLDGRLSERWRSLAEVRFLLSPNGQSSFNPDGSSTTIDTTVADQSEYGHNLRWSGISIERLWIQYEAHESLTIRVGQWLTPYGIWNVDHGSPTLIGIGRPFLSRFELFPEHQTGIELLGKRSFRHLDLGYHLTVSNGRGPTDAIEDMDANKAVGGRLFLHTAALRDLTLGGSFYAGTFTRGDRAAVSSPDGGITVERIPRTRYRETAIAGDVRWQAGGLTVQAEAAADFIRYVQPYRPLVEPSVPGVFVRDNTPWGAYGLVGYRFAWFGVMPYVRLEIARFAEGALPSLVGHIRDALGAQAGLNLRPHPSVVLKAEVTYGTFPHGEGWGRYDFVGMTSQVAWVF